MPSPSLHQQNSRRTAPRFSGAHLRELCESFRTETVSFEALRDLTEEQIRKNPSGNQGLNKLLAQVSDLTQPAMVRMNEEYPGIPPDTFETTHGLVTNKGAKTVLLRGILPGEEDKGEQLLGYGIMIQGRDNIPDLYHIPKELQGNENASRVIRLFVTDDARMYLARGDAFTQIFNRISTLVGDGPGIFMMLEHMHSNAAEAAGKNPAGWYDALKATVARGLESTEFTLQEKFGEGDTACTIDLRWHTWPPRNPETLRKLQERTGHFEALAWGNRYRLAWTSAAIPGQNALVMFSGRAGFGYTLSQLYPGNMIAVGEHLPEGEKKRTERRPNLIQGKFDRSGRYLPNNSANAAILYGITPDIAIGGDVAAVGKYIKEQAKQLKPGGTIIIRDTLTPRGPDSVKITLSRKPLDAHTPSPDAAFREFISERIEPHLTQSDFDLVTELSSPQKEKVSVFIVPLKLFHEFRSKYPYYYNWKNERKRPYGVAKVEEVEEMASSNGLRLILSTPEDSPYHKRRFGDKKIVTQDLAGRNLGHHLPDHHVIIAEKVSPGDGIRILDTGGKKLPDPSFVKVQAYIQKDTNTGEDIGVQEIGTRKGVTLDVVPYFIHNGELFIKGRILPRPLLSFNTHTLDGSKSGTYQIEQIAGITADQEQQTLDDATQKILFERAKVDSVSVISIDPSTSYFPRPDTVDEMVHARPVQIQEDFEDHNTGEKVYNLHGSPKVRTLNAILHLQGCQVGTIQDPRLERVIYSLSAKHKLSTGAWLGAEMSLRPQEKSLSLISIEQILHPQSSSLFEPVSDQKKFGFFEVSQHHFEEKNSRGKTIGTADPEFIEPAKALELSANSFAVLPVMLDKSTNEILVGVEVRDYATVQNHSDIENPNAALATIPTYRLPEEVKTLGSARRWISRRMKEHFNISLSSKKMESLGGKYRVSPGISPETMYPHIAEVDASHSSMQNLKWIPLKELHAHADEIQCGQLRTAVYRAWHMLVNSH